MLNVFCYNLRKNYCEFCYFVTFIIAKKLNLLKLFQHVVEFVVLHGKMYMNLHQNQQGERNKREKENEREKRGYFRITTDENFVINPVQTFDQLVSVE